MDVKGVPCFASESAWDEVSVIRSHQLTSGMPQTTVCWPQFCGGGLSINKRESADKDARPMPREEAFHRAQTRLSGPQDEGKHHGGGLITHTEGDHGPFLCDTQ